MDSVGMLSGKYYATCFLILPYMNDTILKRVEHKLLLALPPSPPLKKSVLTLRQIENKYILLRTD